MSEQIEEIMNAVDAESLFSSNAKRAQIKYRRLMRAVHPDFDSSAAAADAATRLNSLWEDWQQDHGAKPKSEANGKTSKPKTKTTRVARAGSTALFSVGDDSGDWLEVERDANSVSNIDGVVKKALAGLHTVTKDSPVSSPFEIVETAVPQKNGPHAAVTFKTKMKTGWSLVDIKKAYPEGIDERDAAWILKRLVFLGAAIEDAGLDADDIGAMVMYHPSGHTLGLCSVRNLHATDSSKALKNIMESFSAIIDPSGSPALRRMWAFAQSCGLNSRPAVSELLREYDEILLDLFGAPSFHAMKDPRVRISASVSQDERS